MKTRVGNISLLVFMALVPVVAEDSKEAKVTQIHFEERSLGKLPTGTFKYGVHVSQDGGRIACIAGRDGKTFLVVNGVEGNTYDDITGFSFSPDGKRLAYSAKRGKKALVVLDGVESEEYDDVVWISFSADSKRFGYAAGRGVSWKTYPDKPNYRERVGGKYFIVTDGRESKDYDSVYSPVFSPDGKRLAFTAHAAGEDFVIVDGVENHHYQSASSPVFSPDSRRIAFIAGRDGKHFVVLDGVEQRSYDSIRYPPTFSPDGKKLAYAALRDGKYHMVVNGREGRKYDGIGSPVFSPDSKRIAYVIGRGESPDNWKESVVVDGKEWMAFDRVWGIIFSPDSKRFAFDGYRGDKAFVVVDGKESIGGGAPYFSPDSKHEAHWALFGASEKGAQWGILVEGRKVEAATTYDLFANHTEMEFDAPQSFHTFAVRNGDLFRVDVEIGVKK